jgi:hypothetical protein
MMIKRLTLSVLLTCALALPVWAKNLAVPAKDPVATLMIPDSWKPEAIDFGFSAKSPDGDIFFAVEYAAGSRVAKMLASNDVWLKENKIKAKGEPTEREFEFGGLPAKHINYKATDPNGDTEVDFIIIPAGTGRVIMLTLWGSKEEQEKNRDDLNAIQRSFKAIN